MTNGDVCQFLEWDTEFFGVRIARTNISPKTEEEIKQVIDWCNDHVIRCLYLLMPLDDPNGLYLAHQYGFFMTDIRLTYERKSAPISPISPNGIAIRQSLPSDTETLMRIAEPSYRMSRFYNDPHFTQAQADQLYRIWTENYCRELPHQVLVSTIDEKPVGYTAYRFHQANIAQVELLAVDSAVRGKGIGYGLLDSLLQLFEASEVPSSFIVTQGRNIVAQRLYQRFGYLISQAEVWLHRWF